MDAVALSYLLQAEIIEAMSKYGYNSYSVLTLHYKLWVNADEIKASHDEAVGNKKGGQRPGSVSLLKEPAYSYSNLMLNKI